METVSVTARMDPSSSAGPQPSARNPWSAAPVAPMASAMPSVASTAMGTALARTLPRSAVMPPSKSSAGRHTRNTTSGCSGGTPGSRWAMEMRSPPTTSATL